MTGCPSWRTRRLCISDDRAHLKWCGTVQYIARTAQHVTTHGHNHLFLRKILNSTTQAIIMTSSVTG